MATSVNAGARLDRLPISSFHYRVFALVGAGMFFDGYDLYVAGGVLAATIQTKFSTLPQNLQFLSLTFVGMTLGSGSLMVDYGVAGVIWLMIGSLVIQIIVVAAWAWSRVPAHWRMSRSRRLKIVGLVAATTGTLA